MSFSKLGLAQPLVDAIADLNYQQPTAIQRQAIPLILKGRDVIAASQTGSGKTASFVLPVLEKLRLAETKRKKRMRALIIVPTRELAIQVQNNVSEYAQYLSITSMVMYGGVDDGPQKRQLIDGVDIVVATPGRLLDMYTQRAVHFDELEYLILDEADRMLDMGFIDDINKIIEKLPIERQSLLFSATLSSKVRALAKTAVSRAAEIGTKQDEASQPNIEQWLVTVDKDKKSALLSHLIQTNNWGQTLIFIETKQGAAKLVSQLEKRSISAECIHSGRSQEIRERVLADFKAGTINILIATGVAARGLDIVNLPRVVNYDLPFPAENYVHRIGRTGRAGAVGEAVSFVSKDNFKNLCMIESLLGHLIERREIAGFEPKKAVPVSILNYVPKNQREATQEKDKTKRSARDTQVNNKKQGKVKEQDKQVDPWNRSR